MKSKVEQFRRRWGVSPSVFRRITYATLVFCAVIIVTGGAVRLTQSGLGCPTWPNCTNGSFVAHFALHPMIEFVNRVVTFFAGLGMSVTAIFAFLRRPYRRDLFLYSLGLVAGVVVEAVLGGITVLEKLAPPFVMAHFILAVVVLWNAVVLYKRAISPDGKPRAMVGSEIIWISRLMMMNLALVVVAGTFVAGTGPYSGSPIAVRLPLNLRQVTYLHADIALFLIALTLANLFLLHQARVSEAIQRRARVVFWLEVIQGSIGYFQYFAGFPALPIGFHIAGAAVLWIAMTWYYLSLFRVAPDAEHRPVAAKRRSSVNSETVSP
ncbi:MAG: COX15/CtaA family protein [Ferrimicrobium sp.]